MNTIVQSRPRVLEPGLYPADPRIQRMPVRAQGLTCVELGAGDLLDIVSPEGLQPCELVALDGSGRNCLGALGLREDRSAQAIPNLLRGTSASSKALNTQLKNRGTGPGNIVAAQVFGRESPPGHTAHLSAEQAILCIIAAPGSAMRVDEQNPPTDLVLFVHRKTPGDSDEITVLPDPLGDPIEDFQVDRRTARAYEVKAGEFIQIIDIQGRECSDFQCFNSKALSQGIERHLDPTTTRTVMGMTYPGPGLFSKFYDMDMQQLVEVIQDTCGRHDSFGLACCAKYYEEMGYPGHVNCSDNFNKALAPYSIAPRRGWVAMNLFFNTGFDDNNLMYFDEPWSRPGDYVLLRALTDMVCVSSACPCDIDGANGWNPTDIHVRTYSPASIFKSAVAYRMTTDSAPELSRETGFHARTSQHTRNFIDYNGYWLANSYTRYGAVAEYWACREGVVAIDLSPLRKFEVTGPDAELLMNTCVTRNIHRLASGQVVYTAMCYETGTMIDDGTVFRLGQDNFRWIGGADSSGLWLRKVARERGLRAWVRRSTDQLHNLQIQGPESRALLSGIIWTRPDQPTVEELGWFRFSIARIGHEDGIPIIVSRTGYTGELGFEVFCHPDDGVAVWDAIWRAGEAHHLVPLGLEALDMLRIEAGLIFAGYEFSDQTDPFEAGIPFTVPLKTKDDDFIGRQALIRRKANPQRVLVGLELAGQESAANGDCVHIGRQQTGTITSGVRSPILKKNIALCRMDIAYSAPGTEVEVGKLDGHQKRLPATVVPFPFYDPEKSRVRS